MNHSLNLFLQSGTGLIVILILAAWSYVWKGLALWKAGGKKDLVWFIILLVLNTIGILDMIYYFLIGNEKSK